ncbi:MAG: hypothetical protein JNL79_35995, partial [Myxococcales bacterium]|nr:hypothetical protein [Myxococcales bacterium]
MPIEIAPSGRATCRTCRRPIAKGSLRFATDRLVAAIEIGQEFHHLPCAAAKQLAGFAEALDASPEPIPDLESLRAALRGEGVTPAEAPEASAPPASFEERIAAVDTAVAEGDDRRLLRALVSLWALAPEDDLAATIEAVGRRVEVAELEGKTLVQQDADFDARLAARDAADLPTLAHHALVMRGTMPIVATRLVGALRALSPDPRLTEALVKALRHPPFPAQNRESWDALFSLLAHGADPRTPALLEAVDFAASFPGHRWITRADGSLGQEPLADLFVARRKRFLAKFKPAPRHPDGAAVAKRLRARLAPASVDFSALVAQVLEAPGDEALRAVLRDAWLEAGDPRGEHVVLCELARTRGLTEEEQARRRRLEGDHYDAWAEGLGQIRWGRTFDRGFLDGVRIDPEYDEAQLLASLDRPAWRTVTHVDTTSIYQRPMPVAALERLGQLSLRAVSLRGQHLGVLVQMKPAWLEQLTLDDEPPKTGLHRPFFPALSVLDVRCRAKSVEAFSPLLGSTAIAGLQVLAFTHRQVALAQWLTAVAAKVPVPVFVVRWGDTTFTFTRVDGGFDLLLTLHPNGRVEPRLAQVVEDLGGLPTGALRVV